MSTTADAFQWALNDRLGALLAPPVLFVRALPHPVLERLQPLGLTCSQTFKPEALALQRLGFTNLLDPGTDFGTVVVAATRFKQENLYHLALGAERLREGGLLVGAGPNALGASSLEMRCRALMGDAQSVSKHKCRVFWAAKRQAALDASLFRDWLALGELRPMPGTGLLSRPGMFCWDRVDQGSALLAKHLPDNLSGAGADLGAGYGYLSAELLARNAGVQSLAVFEAERSALSAAQRNLAPFAGSAHLSFQWWDVHEGLAAEQFDWVIMNPPFHYGDVAEVDLGRAFLRTAAAGLKPGGMAYVVANRRLPYEAEIDARFTRRDELAVEGGYKVLRLTR